jgi:uncharacterized GH25 family protein
MSRGAMSRGVRIGLALFLGARAAAAHDFWVQPREFWVQPQSDVPISLQAGHGESRQRSPLRARRVERFAALGPDGALVDLRGELHLGEEASGGELRFERPGAYVLALETDDRAQSHLPAARFNAYLAEEGLTLALEERRRSGRMDVDGSEAYRRCAKSIVQVGAPSAGEQAQLTRPLGLQLEIVPERSPFAEPRAAELPVRVLWAGEPLAGALVKLIDLAHDERPFALERTDASGRARFAVPASGSWLLNVVWTTAAPVSSETDFETVFSSLSFGFPTPRS